MVNPLVVGFDLDLTLVDSRPGIAATYRALSERTGVYIDADAAVTRLGPPLEDELALWFPSDQVDAMGDLFRQLYPRTRSRRRPRLPGAAEAFAAVRARGGRVVVITGKYEPNARLHLDHLGLAVDEVVGWAWAEGKVDSDADPRGGRVPRRPSGRHGRGPGGAGGGDRGPDRRPLRAPSLHAAGADAVWRI